VQNIWLAGAALAASMASTCLVHSPALARPAAASAIAAPSLWVANGRASQGTIELLGVLRRAQLDGLDSGPALAARAEALLQRSQAGDARAAVEADQLLSTAWVRYVQALERPVPGVEYADGWAKPRRQTPAQILARAKSAPSLARHVAEVSMVNPVYARLRDSAWNTRALGGGHVDARVLASLERARHAPKTSRYVLVDAASSTLWMVEGGRIVDEMPVITGQAGKRTPMIASTLYYATLNPYWNVPQDMVRDMIAPRVIDQGVGYLTERDYEVFETAGTNAVAVDPASVDWRAVAQGQQAVKLRRKPGEWNSMGRMKFGFANASDIFLHDTPEKALFAKEDRNLSAGCIRLSDAPRFARWLLQGASASASGEPEQHVALPGPVPVYITYLTAHATTAGDIAFVDDVYGLDTNRGTTVAGLR
jgi:murein L,D-transpeptidase YcbB/YkuD